MARLINPKKTGIKYTLSTLIFTIILGIATAAQTDISLEKYHVHLKVPNKFAVTEQTAKRLTLSHEERLATINIRVYNFIEAVTANGFQTRRRIGHYDGWENLLERDGTAEENQVANVMESYVAVYSKNQLDQNLVIQKLVVAEYYYIKAPERGIVISVFAKHQDWPDIKGDVRKLIDNFWVGPDDRETVQDTKKKSPFWVGPGKTPQNEGSSTSNFSFSAPPEEIWDITVETKTAPNMAPLLLKDRLIYGSGTEVISIDSFTGEKHWEFTLKSPLQSPITFHDNRLFFMTEGTLTITQADTGIRLHERKLGTSTLSAISVTDKAILFIADNTLYALDPLTYALNWQKEGVTPHQVPVQSDTGTLVMDTNFYVHHFNLETGEKYWKTQLKYITYHPAIIEGNKAYLIFEGPIGNNERAIHIHQIQLDTGKIEWTFSSGPDFWLKGSPTLFDDTLYALVEMKQFQNPNHQQLIAIDTYSGKSKWTHASRNPVKPHTFRPYVTNQLVFYTQATPSQNQILAIDAVTGTELAKKALFSMETFQAPYFINSIENQLFIVNKHRDTTHLKSYLLR